MKETIAYQEMEKAKRDLIVMESISLYQEGIDIALIPDLAYTSVTVKLEKMEKQLRENMEKNK